MTRPWAIGSALLLTIILLVPVISARGAPIDVTVTSDKTTLHLNLALNENLTSLPVASIYVDSSNASMLEKPIAQAVQKLVPTATISNLTLRARTFNSSGTWLQEENYTLVITGINTDTGGVIRSEVGFLSMSILDSITEGGLELNTVGVTYLLPPLRAQENRTVYYINDHQTLNSVIPVQTTISFRMLDFSWIPPIFAWTRQDDLLTQLTVWTFNLGGPRFNLTYGTPTPEGTLLKTFTAVYNPSFQLTVPANAWSDGTVVSFDLPTPAELLMPLIAALSLLGLVTATILDRHLTRTAKSKRRR